MKKPVFFLTIASLALVLGGAGCLSFGGNAADGAVGMFGSIDKAETWRQISTLPTVQGPQSLADVAVYRLVPDPSDPQALYWLSLEQGLFYTYNEGRTWQRPETGPFQSGIVASLAVHPQERCTLYATNGTQVFKTEDCSRSWEEVYRESRSDTKVVGLSFNSFDPHQIFLAESGGDLLQSADGGRSWSVVKRFGVSLAHVVADPLEEGVIYVISRRDALFRSVDGGETWVSLEDKMNNFSGALEYRRFAFHPTKPGVIYWISTYGIIISEDGGDDWRALSLITPPGSAQIYGFAVNPKDDNEMYYTATINGRSTLYKTEDGGENWITKKLPSGQLPTVLYVHPEKDSVIYLGFSLPPKQ